MFEAKTFLKKKLYLEQTRCMNNFLKFSYL